MTPITFFVKVELEKQDAIQKSLTEFVKIYNTLNDCRDLIKDVISADCEIDQKSSKLGFTGHTNYEIKDNLLQIIPEKVHPNSKKSSKKSNTTTVV